MKIKSEYKLIATFCLLIAMALAVFTRTAFIMLYPSEKLSAISKRQFNSVPNIKLRRGKIFDRNRTTLALSLPVHSLYINPARVTNLKDANVIIRKISHILQHDYQHIYKKFKSKKNFVWLKRKLTFNEDKQIRELLQNNESANGYLGLVTDSQRFYPNGSLAAHILGFTGIDSDGLEGIELQYNDTLDSTTKAKIEGDSLVLTIDSYLQAETEKTLKNAIKRANAKSGSAIVMDAITGEIWALANYPTYNPNRFREYSADDRRNRAITDLFEPGSTFKILTVGAGLEAKLLTTDKKIYCEGGSYRVGDKVIRESDPNHKWHWLLPEQIVKHSSNIGAVKIGNILGKDALYAFLEKIHLVDETGIDLPGEIGSMLREKEKISEVGFANLTFGQGVSITVIKLAQFFSSVANGGLLVKPTIVKEVLNFENKQVFEHNVEINDRIMKPTTSRKLSEMMEKVVDKDGSGWRAAIKGVRISGKTGTAQKAEPGLGYAKGKYISSFAGFVQRSNPRLVTVVVINEPEPPLHFGGSIAAPAFQKITTVALARSGVVTKRIQLAKTKKIEAASEPVQVEQSKAVVMPRVVGLSSRDVLRKLPQIDIEIKGVGLIYKQYPAPGERLNNGTKVKLFLSNKLPDTEKLKQ